ncbi:amidohydrolase [Streptomyces decoyicus]|uniref:amidohydrolase n=1 Tax=Streptomyces decoyicus TaxID=249567 RepID=UPI002E36C817|nr:amidohydrolase [Streptomyces decoyicus]
MSSTETVHDRIRHSTAELGPRLWDVAQELHRHPELAFEEHRSAALLSKELDSEGFIVERGVAGMETAFTARAGNGDGPCVALLLEYDALPDLGHACGHNLIAGAGLGAALALHNAMPEIDGTLLVVGTPAEEGGGGKAIEVEAGVFDGVDAALMFHPGVYSWSSAPLTAQVQYRVGFHGRAAHPTGNPTEGLDALAALIQLFNTVAVVQRRLPEGSHIQGIITEGGRATNIVPDYAEGRFGLRGITGSLLDELIAELARAAEGIALATGTRVELTQTSTRYEHFRNSDVLSATFAEHLSHTGMTVGEPTPGIYLGSSDIGNVSARVPAIHPFVAILGPDESDHTPRFAEAAGGPDGRKAMLASAEALARTAADVLLRPELGARAWSELRRKEAAGL